MVTGKDFKLKTPAYITLVYFYSLKQHFIITLHHGVARETTASLEDCVVEQHC